MTGGQAAAPGRDPVSPLAAQLQRGFRWLRFDPGLEAAYRVDQFNDRIGFLRTNLFILAALVFVIVEIDHVVMPAVRMIVPDLVRIGVIIPLLGIGFALTFWRGAATWYPRVMSVLQPIVMILVAWIGLQAWEQGEPRVFVRLPIAMVATYFVLGLPCRTAVAGNVVAIAFYIAAATIKGMPGAELTYYLAMLLMTSVICAAGAYNLEHATRTAWLEGQLLAETALQDGLTGIPNRRRFDEHLPRAWHQAAREGRTIALLLADIDHFKRYNDRYGHQAGDEAMRAVAGVLAGYARRPLDLAARYGGEEFALLLFGAPREQAARIAEEILAAVRALAIDHADSGAAPVLTVSVGIASVTPVARRSCAGLVQLADQALYAAKDGGRDRAALLQEEYDHMKTGYFRRHLGEDGGPTDQ